MLYKVAGLAALSLLPFTLAQISNDFESGWDQTTWPIYAPDCNQGGTVALDSTVAHSGTNSMKVTSPGGYCGHIFFGTTAIPSGDVYVRVWVRATNALTSNHISFLTMPDSSQGTNENLRFGGQDQILMYNRESDDATMPDMSPQGTAASVPLPTLSWQCLEYHLGTDGTIETWLNSNDIPGLTIYPGVTNPDATQFQRTTYIPKITGVYFGWESYGSDANTMWYDDISIQSSRVGCGSTGTTSPTTSSTTTTTTTTTTASPTTTTKSTTTSTTTASPTTTTKSTTTTTKSTTTTTTTKSTTTTTPTTTAGGAQQTHWGQCAGTGYSGPTVCASPYTCTYSNPYYSQCL